VGGIVIGQEAAANRVTSEDAITALHEAIGVILSVCDYAQSDDAQGFNAADAWLGHVLAQMPAALWTDDAALATWEMLRKYRGQLAAAGIGYDDLPRPVGADELEAGRREHARQRAREHAQHWREQQYRQARTYLRCDADGGNVTLAFPYDPDLVAACRAIPGRRYDGAAKANVFPFTSLAAVIELADAHQIEVTAEVRALAKISTERAGLRATLPPVRLDDRSQTIIIDAPFNPDLNQALKDANHGRSTWDRNARVHRLTLRAATALPALAERFGLEISEQAREAITGETAWQDQNRADASAFEADPVPVPGLAAGTALKAQQYPVVRFALAHRRVLIGDDMGWGKTLSSLAVVAADGAYPAVVVCRPSLTLNWAAEIGRFFPALTVHQATGTTPVPVPPGTDVIVIGSAALAAKPRKAPNGIKEFGWVEALAAAAPRALIIDEGQDTKERAANRSRACEQLAAAVTARDGLVLDLTGTAILNRPRELCQQLTILGRISEFGGPKAFLWRYCLSETNEWGASYNGARNLIELHDRLRAWGIMVRRSDDAALGLPPCREHVLCIPQADLDPAVMDRYRHAEADLLGYLAEQARQAARQLGEDPDSAAVQAVMRASAAGHLVAIGALRQLAGQAKRAYVTAWIRERAAAGEKVMVAAHHRDLVDAYAEEFGGLKLQGGQPVEQKEAVKATFQEQPAAAAPVISVAIGAGGVGHTLTAARIGIQAEQAWTPGETQQMKKRPHRIGQDRPVDYYITVAEGTIDEHLWQVVTAKQATLDAVLDGRSDQGAGDDEASVAAELTWRLTQQGLSGTQPAGDTDHGAGSPTRRVLVTGSRAWTDEETIASALAGQWHDGNAVLVTGACPRGADEIAERIWRARGGQAERHPADWSTGRDAGMRRNADMVALGADVCLAFIRDGSPGAIHAARLAEQAGIPVHRFETGSTVVASTATCTVCGTAMAIIEPGQTMHPLCEEDPDGAKAAGARPVYGQRDEITVRHWRQAHVDPEKVRAWCRETGRTEPPARGTLPAELVGDYLAERGAADIPMPGGSSRADWLAQRPMLREPFTARLGWRNGPTEPFTVVYGPCPRCGGPTSAPPGESLPPCLDCASRASSDGDDDQAQAEAGVSGQRLREFAHRYLEEGLWPVPAWGARPGGECCCPRGADCPRPGKHPRSVHAGPGPRDYSWKPLACRTPAEVDQRFAPGGRYAAGNLMVAIPPEMMAIDRDDDDGGRAAVTELAAELGKLPPTLAHRTPHGEHLIYRTPPGWEGRAWVGKDPANPVPAGVDLRMPGQILMAAPSVVPGPDGQARYGPVSSSRVAPLPATYLTAWTPPEPAPRPPSRPIPIPPDGADRAARYVHDALTDIAAELAGHPPGGRNAAAYTAGLKAGSLLGAARATPGGEQAAAAWTDESAEQALVDAAQRNGYVDKDGEAEALSAIRSGLRNGLHHPRALPDFTAPRPAQTTSPRPQADGPRMRANRAAVAANQAYRAGDLDAARQLIDQAAALDPGRADLWQQHQEQISARRLILDAQAAHADSDHQRVQELLGQAHRLDPRMPAIWDGDLPGLTADRTTRQPRERAIEPGPAGPASSSPVAQDVNTRQQVRAAVAPADPEVSRPSWPESLSRSDPSVPAPRSAAEPGGAQPSPQRDPAAMPSEPEARAEAIGDMRPGAEAADDDPSTRWPAPNPRVALVHAEVSGTANTGGPAASTDWRDRLLADASRPWQPVPSQPRDPFVSVPPERHVSRPGIEPDT
jgi:Bifunctional DNA primase/polymerase, N-terminal/SNF2-related domain/YspA, cpYpsA-related SLOG family